MNFAVAIARTHRMASSEAQQAQQERHEQFMQLAIREALRALDDDEVPIGAVVISPQGRIIGKGYNQVERLRDATAHAEMIALTAACHYMNAKYLPDCTLYVTVEPCAMCAGALRWAQLGMVVYGAAEEKYGYRKHEPTLLHPRTKVVSGVLSTECAHLMQSFFRDKRHKP